MKAQEYETRHSGDESKETRDIFGGTTRPNADQNPFGVTNARLSRSFLEREQGCTKAKSDRVKSIASYLPYELLERIFRWYLLFSNSMAPCLVSKNWRSVASEVLYETVAPRSFTAARLLLHTLAEDHSGYYKQKIKRLHLPIVCKERNFFCGETGIHSSRWVRRDFTRKAAIPDECNREVVTRRLAEFFSYCPSAVEIHIPLFRVFDVPPGLFLETSNLRRLQLTGEATLDVLLAEVFEKAGTSSLANLESIGMYGFGGRLLDSMGGSYVIDVTTPIDLENLHGKPTLQKLHTLHMENGDLASSTLFSLLSLVESTLTNLTILNTHIHLPFQNTVPHPRLLGLKTLTIDTTAASNVFRKQYYSSDARLQPILRMPPNLHALEFRLLEDRFDSTPCDWFPTNLVKKFPIERWNWIQDITSSLKLFRFVMYNSTILPPEVGQWKAADGLKQLVCRGRPELEHLQVEVHQRDVI